MKKIVSDKKHVRYDEKKVKNQINKEQIIEKITRRRRQILVHSIIYYNHNENLISDYQWAQWARELVELQKKWPEESKKAELYTAYIGFDGSTGFDLPLGDPYYAAVAARLLKYEETHKNI